MARSNVMGKLAQIVEATGDPREVIKKQLGDLSKETVLHSQILAAIMPGSQYHPGTKILRTDRDIMEGRFQGSIFVVVKVGPGAFKDDPPRGVFFHGKTVKEGDLVLCRASDGLELLIREVPCRLFEDVNVKMIVSDSEWYW